MADNSQRIAEIQDILRAGASSSTVDGTTIQYDFAALRAELRKLQQDDPSLKRRRPMIGRFNLG